MTTPFVTVEACVTSAEETSACFAAGANRVELCRDLDVGGLTPEPDLVSAALKVAVGDVFVLVRPKAGSFQTTPSEANTLIEDVGLIASLGVQGIVVGSLTREGKVDRAVLRELVDAANDLPVTFHRAIDEVENPLSELDSLIDAGVTRVLTSGGAASAWEGRDVLRKLVERGAGEITILGGGGIRGEHVGELILETGLTEVHARASAISGVLTGLR